MAKVTTTKAGVTFTLEIDEAEAKYVLEALGKTDPVYLPIDTVYEALHAAMEDADVDTFTDGHAR